MTRIAHLSDLHFGKTDKDQLEELGAKLQADDIDHVIVTGDLTQEGRKKEFEAAAEWFARLPMPSIAVPGNHDTPVRNLFNRFVDPWGRFERHTGFKEEPIERHQAFVFAGLNSARRMRPSLDWSTGKLSDSQLESIGPAFAAAGEGLRLCGFHHPLKAFEQAGSAGKAVLPDSDRILHILADAKVDIVMTGHVHRARITLADDHGWTFILSQAGTAVSTRLRGEPASYNVIELLGDGETRLSVHRWVGESFSEESVRLYQRGPDGWGRGQ